LYGQKQSLRYFLNIIFYVPQKSVSHLIFDSQEGDKMTTVSSFLSELSL